MENAEFLAMCESMWNNYFQQRVAEMLRGSVSCYRAQVVARPGGSQLTVQRPFDDAQTTLPCVYSVRSAAIGAQVVVLELGGAENSVVVSTTDFQNL